jgi:hypothetical protein
MHKRVDIVDDVLLVPTFLVKGYQEGRRCQGFEDASNVLLEAGGNAYMQISVL